MPRIRRKFDGALHLHETGASNNGNNNYNNNANASIKEKSVINVAELETKTLNDLREMARKLDISGVSGLKKQDLIFKLLQAQTEEAGHSLNDGILVSLV